MFEALAEAISELDIPPVGDAIAEAIALRDRLGAVVCDAVGKFFPGSTRTAITATAATPMTS